MAKRLDEVLAGKEGVRVARPTQIAEIRIHDLDDSVAIAAVGGCPPSIIKTVEIRSSGGMGTIWVRCSLAAANKLIAAKKIRVGWVNARVEALEKRPLQCFMCLEKGHVKAQCGNGPDRAGCCYKCGEPGHLARDCASPVKCPVCKSWAPC